MVLEKIPSAPGAAFDSFTDELNARCHPDTRVGLLHQIREWAKDRQGKCIFWLEGMAGTGKSTISRTVAHTFASQKRLGASFFFTRGGGDLALANKFFTTLARQLANMLPSFKRSICTVISGNPDIAQKHLRDQWKQLVFQPLSAAESGSLQSSA